MNSHGIQVYIPNLDPNDRPRVENIGEIVRVQTANKKIVYISLESQGTFRLEGKQADSLVNSLKLMGINGGYE